MLIVVGDQANVAGRVRFTSGRVRYGQPPVCGAPYPEQPAQQPGPLQR